MIKRLLNPAYGQYLVPLYFFLLLIISCWILPEYGVGWDEDGQHQKGRITYDYAHKYFGMEHEPLEPNEPFATYDQRFYNMVFPLAATALSESLGISSMEPTSRASMLVWHYLLFGVCFIGFIAFYRLLLLRFDDWRWALLGLSLLLLSARVSFHTFFNIKDSVMQAVVTIAALTFFRLLDKRTFGAALVHGAVCGLAIAVRPVGVILPALTVAFFVIERLNRTDDQTRNISWPSWLIQVIGYIAVLCAVTTALWPFLWESPYENFLLAWEKFSAFPWSGELLLFNEKLAAELLPWHYIPGWVSVTIPVVVLLFFLAGSWQTIRTLCARILKTRFYSDVKEATDLFQLAIVIGSVAAVIYLGSILYDSWRHLYFIYPAMVYVATVGLYRTLAYARTHNWQKARRGIHLIVGINLVYLLGWCLWMHPFQYNYFNPLAGNELEKRYEVDYWGLGYQTALRWILEHDDREAISVYVPNYSGQVNSRVLPKNLKHRIIAHGNMPEHYDYFISNFRFPEVRDKYKAGAPPFHNPLYFFKYPYGRGVMIGVYGPGGNEEPGQ